MSDEKIEATDTEDLSAEESAELEASKVPVEEPDEVVSDDDGDAEPAEVVAEAVEDKPEKKFVPLQALDSERGKRQKLEEQLAALQAEIQSLRQPQQPKQEASADMPDPILDPDGFKGWMKAEQQKLAEPYQRTQQQQEQAMQMQRQVQALVGYAKEHEDAFRETYKDSDYDGALQFMRQREQRKFEIMGFSPAEAAQRVTQSEIAVTAQAAQMRQNPAALIYNLALENGFTPKQAKAAAAAASDGEKITRLADVQAKTRSTAGLGGAPRPDEYSLRDLAEMDPDELYALEKKDPAKFRKMIGG